MTQENKSITARDEGIALINPDLLLTLLVQMVDKKPPFDIGITLFVQGSIVTGLLIGEDVYLEGLSNDMPDFFSDFFQKLSTLIQSGDTNSPGNQEEQNQLRNIEFIHLKNAKFFLGNSLVPNNKGTYWRGRLSRVDGFSLGQLFSNN